MTLDKSHGNFEENPQHSYNAQGMFPLAIIADDLTGALDAAAAFCCNGVNVVVAVNLDAFEKALATKADVVAVSTASRESLPDVATALVEQAVALSGRRNIIKKIDSRLKGHLSAELAPFADKQLFVAPALPSFGRYVEGGFVRGFGVDKPIDIGKRLGSLASNSVIPDCKTTQDVCMALDRQLQNNRQETVLVGARGLTFALAKRAGLVPITPAKLSGKIGMVIGSTDPITVEQFDKLPTTKVTKLLAPSGLCEEEIVESECVAMQATSGPISDPIRVGRQLANSFARVAKTCDTLVLTGGATAEAVLAELGVNILYMEGEISPGLPVSHANKWRVVTKSGGFGDVDTLARLLE